MKFFESLENEKKRKNYQNKQRIRSFFVSSHDLQEPLRKIQTLQIDT
jgi:light-regulated signal transduction histidine kinase (bacteriophytochrome)